MQSNGPLHKVLQHPFIRGRVHPKTKAITLIKGFDVSETGILSVSETIKDKLCIPVCTLSGANIANKIAAQNFSDIYNNLGRYWSGIVWSIENVIVIGAGIVDGLKRGENTKMTIIRVEFLEMKKFIQMFYHGVKEETFSELWNCQCDCYLLWRQIC
ncbi:3340_t:CDS:2 [Entrophospora sp. SA101]|nr:3340_t:CDS:2 [Entrophospora sp. SA101]